MFKIGIGYDIHRLVKGRKLILGGVAIPYKKGLKGHSDADVLIHAVCDALLGAPGLGDIGEHFPDSDVSYKDISSLELLKKVKKLIDAVRYKIINIDTTIIAEAPKIVPFKSAMIKNMSGILKLSKEDINIKATTNEGAGALGRGEAIAVFAAVLIEKGD